MWNAFGTTVMIAKILSVVGSGLVSFVVFTSVMVMTGSAQLGILISGICAFTLGIAAGRDGIWRG